MINPQLYEKVVKREQNSRRVAAMISAVLGYICFDIIWILFIVKTHFNVGLIALAIISTCLLFSFTWKYFLLVYEYSFVGSTFTVSKIYADKIRKEAINIDIKNAVAAAPATEENVARIRSYEITDTLYAISSDKAENVWFILSIEKESKKTVCIYFEPDEQIMRIIRQYNSRILYHNS